MAVPPRQKLLAVRPKMPALGTHTRNHAQRSDLLFPRRLPYMDASIRRHLCKAGTLALTASVQLARNGENQYQCIRKKTVGVVARDGPRLTNRRDLFSGLGVPGSEQRRPRNSTANWAPSSINSKHPTPAWMPPANCHLKRPTASSEQGIAKDILMRLLLSSATANGDRARFHRNTLRSTPIDRTLPLGSVS